MPLYNNGFPIGYDARVLNNPIPSPYTNQFGNQTPPLKNYIAWVKDRSAAESYLLERNTIMSLWDMEKPYIYVKSTDEFGNPKPMRVLRYEVVEENKNQEIENQNDIYLKKDEFYKAISELKEAISGKPVVQRFSGNASADSEKSKSNEPANVPVQSSSFSFFDAAPECTDPGAVSK